MIKRKSLNITQLKSTGFYKHLFSICLSQEKDVSFHQDILTTMTDTAVSAKVEVDLNHGEGEAWVDYSTKEK